MSIELKDISNILRLDAHETPKTREIEGILKTRKVAFIKEVLPIGDLVWKGICFERKTAADFIASLLDGRLDTQVKNMDANYNKNVLVIVGDLHKTWLNMLKVARKRTPGTKFVKWSMIRGKLTSIIARTSIQLLYTISNEEYIDCVLSIIKKYETEGKEVITTKPKKIADDKLLTVLWSLPNIGRGYASKLKAIFGTLYNVVNAEEEELKNVLGKTRGERLYMFIRT